MDALSSTAECGLVDQSWRYIQLTPTPALLGYRKRLPAQQLRLLMRHANIETTLALYATDDCGLGEAVWGKVSDKTDDKAEARRPAKGEKRVSATHYSRNPGKRNIPISSACHIELGGISLPDLSSTKALFPSPRLHPAAPCATLIQLGDEGSGGNFDQFAMSKLFAMGFVEVQSRDRRLTLSRAGCEVYGGTFKG